MTMPNRLLRLTALLAVLFASSVIFAEEPVDTVEELQEVRVVSQRVRKLNRASNTELITAAELTRAACCNLGESFSTNPSVDVSYTDAATGARQIKLLGLSGSYVQMLTEAIPNLRGAAAPYGLGYIAGPWMQSISVSKGASSVKNGYESITGQINIEMKKPQLDPSVWANAYYDIMNKLELNVGGNMHFGDKWSAGILTHFENGFSSHDANDDGFTDMPRVRQIALMPRVAYLGSNYVFQAGVKFIDEKRTSGQDEHHLKEHTPNEPLYKIDIKTQRWEAFAKNAFIFDHENDGNLALITSASFHNQDASYGLRICDIDQRDVYASLMFERKWNGGMHALSSGLSFNYDYYRFNTLLNPSAVDRMNHHVDREAVGGAYAQYTLDLDGKFLGMAGLRYDWSDVYGSMVTPRLHLRYIPTADLTFHASAGKGYRSPHPLAEYSYILASSRKLEIDKDLKRESAWNFGIGGSWTIRPGGRTIIFSAEYYYTDFRRQLMLDLDTDPHAAIISTSNRKSFSHSAQIEVTFNPVSEITFTGAWRLTDVKVDYGKGLVQKPLTSKHKALFTLGYSPMMGKWNFDITCTINGGGRMPTPYHTTLGTSSWKPSYPTFATLNAQITRNFRHWSIYLGGENITGYRQKNPIIGANNPWGPDFDATMIYGPLQGAMIYIGFRYNFTKYI